MNPAARSAPPSPTVSPSLYDRGLLTQRTCHEPERVRTAVVLASKSMSAADLRLLSAMLGISDTDLMRAKEILCEKPDQADPLMPVSTGDR